MKGNFLGIAVIFLRQHSVKNKACGLLYTLAHFFQNVVHHHDARTRTHTRPHSRWANVFAKSKKNSSDGADKKMLEFWWLKFDG